MNNSNNFCNNKSLKKYIGQHKLENVKHKLKG